jgi:hypothetical protein
MKQVNTSMPVPVQMTQTCPPTNQPRHPPTRGFAFLAKQRNYKHRDNWHLSHQIPFCGFYLFTLDSKKKMGFQEEEEHSSSSSSSSSPPHYIKHTRRGCANVKV